jgi:hypothetical protein
VVIGISTFFIKSNHLATLPLAASPISATPATSVTTLDNSSPADNYATTYAKCGDTPLLPDYSPLRTPGVYSSKLWSPDCRYLVWSATINSSSGLYLYDLHTQKTTRIYTPAADTVVPKLWLTPADLVFHLTAGHTDYVYNISTQSFKPL